MAENDVLCMSRKGCPNLAHAVEVIKTIREICELRHTGYPGQNIIDNVKGLIDADDRVKRILKITGERR